MSRLLLDEEPLLIMPGLAVKVGLNEAIILQQIHYWLKINKRSNKNYINNIYWTYNTYEEWKKQFPFWSVATIKRAVYKLEKLGLVISTSEFNKLPIDKTKWYTINYENLEKIEADTTYQNETSQNEPMDVSKWNDGRIKMNRPLPETKTKTKSKTSSFVQKDNKDKFNNFQQRSYDGTDGGLTIDQIENQLLGWEQ